MNPYFKYPLIGFLVFIVLLVLVVRGCGKDKSQEPAGPAPVTVAPVPEPTSVQPSATNPSATVTTSPAVQPPSSAPATAISPEVEGLLSNAKAQLDNGMLEAARQIARRVLRNPEVIEFDKTWRRAAEIIDTADKKLMNSTAPVTEKQRYVVVQGDNLTVIAKRKYISVNSLTRINKNVSLEKAIRPTQTLMYIAGKWSIRVSKQHYLLLLYLNDELYRIYTVGIGRDNRTPTGHFLITNLAENPAWYRNDGQIIGFGDPENLLGTRWLKLTPTEDTDPSLEGYGIHGTWDPESCGTSCSDGCVRMRNEDVEELFDFIPQPGGKVPPVHVIIEE